MEKDLAGTIAKLESYIEEMKSNHSEALAKEDREIDVKKLIPKKELALNDDKNRKEEKGAEEEANEDAPLHFSSDDTARPYLSLQTLSDALFLLTDLKAETESQRDWAIVCLSDTGMRDIYFAKTKEEALDFAGKMMDEAMSAEENAEKGKTVYIDEGGEEELKYEPTDAKNIADDESYKPDSAIKERIRVFRGEDHLVMYDEETGSVSRWDIFNVRNKKLTDAIEF